MSRFLGMLKVSAEEASKMVKDGPIARRAYLEHIVRNAHGVVEGLWLTDVGDWDMIVILDMKEGSSAGGTAATLARRAAGMTVAERWIELVEVDDVEKALTTLAS